jgi:outer membrane protein
MRKFLLFSTFLLLGLTSIQAQRYGHLNLGNLISIMPEAAAANDSLEMIQAAMVTKGKEMATQFQQDYVKFATDVKAGNLTPKAQQEQEASLTKRQQELGSLDQLIGQAIEQKRNQLLAPILERAQDAIKDVAQENGYQFVFDTSIFGAIMFAEETEDLMPLVKAKLGIKE